MMSDNSAPAIGSRRNHRPRARNRTGRPCRRPRCTSPRQPASLDYRNCTPARTTGTARLQLVTTIAVSRRALVSHCKNSRQRCHRDLSVSSGGSAPRRDSLRAIESRPGRSLGGNVLLCRSTLRAVQANSGRRVGQKTDDRCSANTTIFRSRQTSSRRTNNSSPS